MSIKAWLRQLSQQRKEKMLIAAEVREINSDEEFQRRYGVSDVEMAALLPRFSSGTRLQNKNFCKVRCSERVKTILSKSCIRKNSFLKKYSTNNRKKRGEKYESERNGFGKRKAETCINL